MSITTKVMAKNFELERQIANPESGIKISIPDADVVHFPSFFNTLEADYLLEQLLENVIWQQEKIKIYGQIHKLPRLTAWYGDEGKRYTYSGITVYSLNWINPLSEIKRRIEEVSGDLFNSVLINRYRDGSDSISWHADDEAELGQNPVIGSVSLGEARDFQMKHRTLDERRNIKLENGSYLLMRGSMQHHWLHQIPKSKKPLEERIFEPYLDILPKSCYNFPIMYKEDELALLKTSSIIVIQVNGKVRGKIEVSVGSNDDTVKSQALEHENVQKFIAGKKVKKICNK